MIRAILDTNIWISFLLKSSSQSSVPKVVNLAFGDTIDLLVPQESIEEISTAIADSRYLSKRVSPSSIVNLIDQIHDGGGILPRLDRHRQLTRDSKDDYLVSYAVAYVVDYLVTGDRDLLVLQQVRQVQVVTPSQFLLRIQ